MDNFIIVIGRQFGCGGREIGQKIAEALGVPYYDKTLLSKAADEFGMDPEIFQAADEKRPSFLRNFLGLSRRRLRPQATAHAAQGRLPHRGGLLLIPIGHNSFGRYHLLARHHSAGGHRHQRALSRARHSVYQLFLRHARPPLHLRLRPTDERPCHHRLPLRRALHGNDGDAHRHVLTPQPRLRLPCL